MTISKGIAKTRLLLVDAELELLASLRVKLSNAGYDVQTARTGAEALSLAAGIPPDLAILEMHLVDMNGVEVATTLKERYGTPFIFLTNASSDEYRQAAEFVGAIQYLSKSSLPDHISTQIHLAAHQNREYLKACERQRRVEQSLDSRSRLEHMIGMYMAMYKSSHDVIKSGLRRFSRRRNAQISSIALEHERYVPNFLELQREFEARHTEIYPQVLKDLEDYFSEELGLRKPIDNRLVPPSGHPRVTDSQSGVSKNERTGS